MPGRCFGGFLAVLSLAILWAPAALAAGGPVAAQPLSAGQAPAGAAAIDRSALRNALAAGGAQGPVTVTGFPLGDGRRAELELRQFHVAGPAARFVVAPPGQRDQTRVVQQRMRADQLCHLIPVHPRQAEIEQHH